MKATARVRITVEIDTDQPWGGDATVNQVWEQAAREGLAKLERLIMGQRGFRIVGKAVPTCVVAAEEG